MNSSRHSNGSLDDNIFERASSSPPRHEKNIIIHKQCQLSDNGKPCTYKTPTKGSQLEDECVYLSKRKEMQGSPKIRGKDQQQQQ